MMAKWYSRQGSEETSLKNSSGLERQFLSQVLFNQQRRQWHPTPVLLAWKIPWTEDPGRLQSMGSLRVGQDFTFTFTFHFHVLEKEMATHSSILAWGIPGMGESGELPSMILYLLLFTSFHGQHPGCSLVTVPGSCHNVSLHNVSLVLPNLSIFQEQVEQCPQIGSHLWFIHSFAQRMFIKFLAPSSY